MWCLKIYTYKSDERCTYINSCARRDLVNRLQCKWLGWTRDTSTMSMRDESLGCICKSEHDGIWGVRWVELLLNLLMNIYRAATLLFGYYEIVMAAAYWGVNHVNFQWWIRYLFWWGSFWSSTQGNKVILSFDITWAMRTAPSITAQLVCYYLFFESS